MIQRIEKVDFQRVKSLWAYFDAAKARAILGDPALALKHLDSAVEWVWTSMDWIESTEAFEILHGTSE